MQPSSSSKWICSLSLTAALALLPGAVAMAHDRAGNDGPMRFRGLDRNEDGKITRDEWRGSNRSFSIHDKNGDGVIAGAEVGAALQAEGYDDFLDIDRDRDGRISRPEWHWDRAVFERLDVNRDGSLTRPEYMETAGDGPDSHFADMPLPGTGVVTNAAASLAEDRHARFTRLDRNGNGLVSHDEWDGDKKSFSILDGNDNGVLSRDEFLKMSVEARKDLFKGMDLNGNGVISRTEWKGDKKSFGRLDVNNDGKLMREEFVKRYDDLAQNLNGMDRDHDGQLTREEWHGDKKAFAGLDNDRDNLVSFAEFVGVI